MYAVLNPLCGAAGARSTAMGQATVSFKFAMLAHHKANRSPLIQLLASKTDQMIIRVGRRSRDLLPGSVTPE
jgi:hypothetical protein